jgi:hypothetical protein
MTDTKYARLHDCPLILSFVTSKLDDLTDMGTLYGTDFTPELQERIVDFLKSLTDEQLAYVFMMQYLTRD